MHRVDAPASMNEKTVQPKPILVAEDDQNDVILLKRLLKKCRVMNELRVVSNGDEAIAYIKGDGIFSDRARHPLPVLFLLDLKMPGKGGMEVMHWLQTWPKPDFPIVILTGARDVHLLNIAYLLGARSFVVKPLDKEEFLLTICKLKGIVVEGEDEAPTWEVFKPSASH
jgi:CheY-like chemotaxis protein